MMKKFLKEKADQVWYWFEENKYQNEGFGVYDKVEQFADFIDECDDESLCGIAGMDYDTTEERTVEELRAMLVHGINIYFEEA